MARTRSSRQHRDLYREVTDRIVAALEQGVAPWVCPWRRDGEGGRPRNGASGHVYKGVNVVLTGMAGFASSRWYTFNQAKHLGGHIRKGEKGTQVIYWTFVDARNSAADCNVGDEADTAKLPRRIPILKCYTVFNAEQIAWPEGSKHAVHQGDDDQVLGLGGDFDDARVLVEGTGAVIRHGGSRAYYSPGDDYIRLPDLHRFDGAGDYYATALHELAHWTGHESRLGRDLTGRFGTEAYAAEELVAELAAAFLGADLGVAGRLQHAEYIGAWLRVLKGDKRAVFTASRLAQEAADYLTARVGRVGAGEAAGGAPEALAEAA